MIGYEEETTLKREDLGAAVQAACPPDYVQVQLNVSLASFSFKYVLGNLDNPSVLFFLYRSLFSPFSFLLDGTRPSDCP
jgi:hypothetical protein